MRDQGSPCLGMIRYYRTMARTPIHDGRITNMLGVRMRPEIRLRLHELAAEKKISVAKLAGSILEAHFENEEGLASVSRGSRD